MKLTVGGGCQIPFPETICYIRDCIPTNTITGATLSISSVKDVLSELLRNGRLGPKGIALLVIGVAFAGNETAKNASMEELKRRSQVKSSSYYQ